MFSFPVKAFLTLSKLHKLHNLTCKMPIRVLQVQVRIHFTPWHIFFLAFLTSCYLDIHTILNDYQLQHFELDTSIHVCVQLPCLHQSITRVQKIFNMLIMNYAYRIKDNKI